MKDSNESSAEKRYDRIAWIFDYMEFPIEMMAAKKWRKRLFSQLTGLHILEVGVGTGKNLGFYPDGKYVIGIDISEKMLVRARKKTFFLAKLFTLMKMDVQALQFPDGYFDTAVSTFVFCSVPDPVKGFKELHRVLKPKGKAYFLEHVRPQGIRGWIFDLVSPIFVRIMGANINRETVMNIENAGFRIVQEENLFSDIFKFIVAERS